MARIKILAESTVPFLRGVIEDLGDVTYRPSADFTPEQVRDKDWLIIRSITKCTQELLEGSRVQLITSATIGYDHIDRDYCERVGISWRSMPGCNAEAVGQYFGSVMSTLLLEECYQLRDKVVGIVGVGHVGRIVERYASAFGMRVLRCDPPRAEREGSEGFVPIEQIAEEADIITLHTPLERTGKYPTYHLCDEAFLKSLRRRPILMNACRGAVCDNEALLRAVRENLVSRLILDCWEHEPQISTALLKEVWLGTPHIAGFSADGKANGARRCVEEGCRFFGIESRHLDEMYPTPPQEPLIDLSSYPDHRIYRALLQTYSPRKVDENLRESYADFERLRREYHYPREPRAYTLLHTTEEEREVAERIGFQVR